MESQWFVCFDKKAEELITCDEDWDDDESYTSMVGTGKGFNTKHKDANAHNKPHPSIIFSIFVKPSSMQKIYVAGLVNQSATGTCLISHHVSNKFGFKCTTIEHKTYLITKGEFQCKDSPQDCTIKVYKATYVRQKNWRLSIT